MHSAAVLPLGGSHLNNSRSPPFQEDVMEKSSEKGSQHKHGTEIEEEEDKEK